MLCYGKGYFFQIIADRIVVTPTLQACVANWVEDSNPLLPQKQAERLGPWCPKTSCPLILAKG